MPNYAKVLAVVFLFLVSVSMLAMYVYDIYAGIQVPQLVTTVLGAAAGTCLHIIGVSYGQVVGEQKAGQS